MSSKFVGAWAAVSWELCPTDGGEPYYPLGKDAMGLLIYSADGYMSVSLMKPGRAPFGTTWLFEGTPAEKVAATETYSATPAATRSGSRSRRSSTTWNSACSPTGSAPPRSGSSSSRKTG